MRKLFRIYVHTQKDCLTDGIFWVICFSFALSTSSGNLTSHQQNIHGKTIVSPITTKNRQKVTDSLFSRKRQRTHNDSNETNETIDTNEMNETNETNGTNESMEEQRNDSRKSDYLFNRKLALWLCRDLLPFNTVSMVGFRQFWSATMHKTESNLPCRATISMSALDDLYTCCKSRFMEMLSNFPIHGTVTFDCWTDNAKRTAYVTYSYHCMVNWRIRTAVLRTGMLSKPHTGEILKNDFVRTIEKFGLSGKILSTVTDCGSNVVKACQLLEIPRFSCVAHICHNVIMTNLLQSSDVSSLQDLLTHLRKIQTKLVYKYAELKAIHDQKRQDEIWIALTQFVQNGKKNL